MAKDCCFQLTECFGPLCCDGGADRAGVATIRFVVPTGGSIFDPTTDRYVTCDDFTTTATIGLDYDGTPLGAGNDDCWVSCPLPTTDGFLLQRNGLAADGDYEPYYVVSTKIDGATCPEYTFRVRAADITCDATYQPSDFSPLSPFDPGTMTDAISNAICGALDSCTIGQLGDVNPSGIAIGEVLAWDGTNYIPASNAGGGATVYEIGYKAGVPVLADFTGGTYEIIVDTTSDLAYYNNAGVVTELSPDSGPGTDNFWERVVWDSDAGAFPAPAVTTYGALAYDSFTDTLTHYWTGSSWQPISTPQGGGSGTYTVIFGQEGEETVNATDRGYALVAFDSSIEVSNIVVRTSTPPVGGNGDWEIFNASSGAAAIEGQTIPGSSGAIGYGSGTVSTVLPTTLSPGTYGFRFTATAVGNGGSSNSSTCQVSCSVEDV